MACKQGSEIGRILYLVIVEQLVKKHFFCRLPKEVSVRDCTKAFGSGLGGQGKMAEYGD